MAKRIPQLPSEQVYPAPARGINLNTCGDLDCGNHGVAPNPVFSTFSGRAGAKRKQVALASSAALSAGVGRYVQSTPAKEYDRVSQVIEYLNDPHLWSDGRVLICKHGRGNATCDVELSMLSNEHLAAEADRLRDHNGGLAGPACGACGRRYLEAPEEFVFNGAHAREGAKHPGVRLLHRPCKGKKGARLTVSPDHARQLDRSDNLRILSAVVNGAGINALRRILDPAPGAGEAGIARIYDRIFWLERVLLAYERAQLARWRDRLARSGEPRHTRIAHDDVVLGVNWETTADRRITALNCSVSADIASGYVFRIDVDFDPTVDPVSCVNAAYFDHSLNGTTLRRTYRRSRGRSFTAPLMAFQRPTGRYDEPALFSAAASDLRLFAKKATEALGRSLAPASPAALQAIADAKLRAGHIEMLGNRWFNFGAPEREGRNGVAGIMTRDVYTKAASLLCLKEMLPAGKLTLVSEQEGAMARVVPHVFQEAIALDEFEWHVVSFDKKARKPEIVRRTKAFDRSFRAFRQANHAMPIPEALHAWTLPRLAPAVRALPGGGSAPFPSTAFASRAFPALWIRSPIQAGGETDKTVGFPILSPRHRPAYRQLGFQSPLTGSGAVLEAAIARRVIAATLQPTSTFLNALRERLSFAKRAGGRATRSGDGSYVNGACFSPRVLIAVLNIFRVHYNFFEPRPYVSPVNKHEETEAVVEGTTSLAVPGTDERIEVPKRRRYGPQKRTPAMRAGIQVVRPGVESPRPPEPAKVLYQPWLFHGTPMWGRFPRPGTGPARHSSRRHSEDSEDAAFSEPGRLLPLRSPCVHKVLEEGEFVPISNAHGWPGSNPSPLQAGLEREAT